MYSLLKRQRFVLSAAVGLHIHLLSVDILV